MAYLISEMILIKYIFMYFNILGVSEFSQVNALSMDKTSV